MSYFESVILGLVQGLGEFLPISSSAHLVILPWIANFKDPGLSFDVALHLGTLVAVVVYFWKDWWELLGSVIRLPFTVNCLPKQNSVNGQRSTINANRHLFFAIIIATIPAAIAGVLLDDWAESTLRHPLLVAACMAILGFVLWKIDQNIEEWKVKDLTAMSYTTALLIGIAQCLALVPGVSRSGITITMALALGFSRSGAARFSFLLSTPIIFGACVFKYKYFLGILQDSHAIVGVFTAAVFGFLSIRFLMKLVQNYSYALFVYYRFVFAVGVTITFFVRYFYA